MLEVDGAIEMKKRLAPMKDGDFSQNHDGKNDFKWEPAGLECPETCTSTR